jgi:dihydroneopterin aldolase
VSDVIRITGLTLHGYHGVFDEEKRDGQTFVIDLAIDLDATQAQATDDVAHTVDYSTVVAAVADIVTGEPFDLIETLAGAIGHTVVSVPGVLAVEVTVHKPDAPLGVVVRDVSFTTKITAQGGG